MATIKQTISFDASPQKVYKAFMDEKEHAAFTGAHVKIENKVGGTFSIWDGYAIGTTKELVPGKKIVQTWRASDWPKDHYSTVTLEFLAAGKSTKLIFTQVHVPEDQEKSIAEGWYEYYWNPLKDYFLKVK
ncbi:SRPBCC domain-containing protein [Candidatus Gottesmanbacteria bacterium]|nr:SRPBCC domain-containing protein [Candidatus Gottesmanbacteria bacterium]